MTEYLNSSTPKELSETDRAKLRKIRHVAFDMDGTIYMGSTLFPYTQETLKRLRENGIGYSFLTNNPTKSVKDYLAKLAGMGIEASEENMYITRRNRLHQGTLSFCAKDIPPLNAKHGVTVRKGRL